MIRKIKEALDKGVANKDVWRFAFDAASWYKAFYIYAQHFLVDPGVGQPNPFPLPWNIEDPIPPVSARFAMITALDHALHNIECLEYILSKRGDNRLTEIKHRLLDDDNLFEEVHGYLRNTNEHDIEYRLEVGKEQGTFQRILTTAIGKFYTNPHFSVKISIPLENTGVSSVFATSVWPFSLIFSLARRNEGNFFQAVPTTLSSSLAEVRLASLVAWA